MELAFYLIGFWLAFGLFVVGNLKPSALKVLMGFAGDKTPGYWFRVVLVSLVAATLWPLAVIYFSMRMK